MRFIPDEFLFMRGCVWMGWNVWVCVCVCVCVCKGGSLPLLSFYYSFYLSYLLVLIDVLLIDPVAVRAAPLREASRDPSPCALTGPGGALLPFGSPWGSQRHNTQRYSPYSCSAPPQTPAAAPPAPPSLPLFLFHCFNKKMKYILHFFVYYLFVLYI